MRRLALMLGLLITQTGFADDPLFPARFSSGKHGFINSSGSAVVPATFAEAHDFFEQLAVVKFGTFDQGKYGYICSDGRLKIEAKWSWAGDFRCGRAWVYDPATDKAGFIDTAGRLVIPCRFKNAGDFQNGIARVALVGPTLDFLSKHVDTVALAQNGLVRWTYVDRHGNELGQEGFGVEGHGNKDQLAPLPAGRFDRFGFVNMKGEWSIAPKFSSAGQFRNGLALVTQADEQGFIDQRGKWIIRSKEDSFLEFSEGLATFAVTDPDSGRTKCGLIDSKGRIVLPATEMFSMIHEFSEGFAVVCVRIGDNERYGYLDETGTVAIKPRFTDAFPFRNGLARARIGDEYVYIRRDGHVVWRSRDEHKGLRR